MGKLAPKRSATRGPCTASVARAINSSNGTSSRRSLSQNTTPFSGVISSYDQA